MSDIIQQLNTFMEENGALVLLGLLFISIILLVMLVLNLIKTRKLSERMTFFMRYPKGDSLEEVLEEVLEDNREMKIRLKNNTNDLVKINEILINSITKTGIVKYNAFPGMAGKVSSSIALLNNENNGLIINCMHGPEGCYTYVKEIMNAKSINPLTKEDEEALKIALQMQI